MNAELWPEPRTRGSLDIWRAGRTRPGQRPSVALVILLLTGLLAGCASGPAPAPAPTPLSTRALAPFPPGPTSGFDTLGVVAYAASMQGKPYVVGGESPGSGFDCSGLVRHVFARFDYALPRSAAAMAAALPTVPLDSVQAADLLFFNTQGDPFSHVGIYLGDGRFIHAPSLRTGEVIVSRVSNQYWRGRLTGARRAAITASLP